MSLGSAWVASAPPPPPTYARRDNDVDKGAMYQHVLTQPPHTTTTTIADLCATQCCNILPVPIRHALDFCVDVAQLTMPTLFIPELRSDDCCIEDFLRRSKMALSYSGSSNNNSTMNKPSIEVAEHESGEPGDTFRFESPQPCSCSCKCCTDRCCFASSAATLRNWMTFSWHGLGATGKGMRYRLSPLRTPNAKPIPYKIVEETLGLVNGGKEDTAALLLPPNYESHLVPLSHESLKRLDDGNSASQNNTSQSSYHHHGHNDADLKNSAAALDDATYTERLFAVNQYLLRRIRKLELTNQIVREAYSEVHEILEAERQSKATQISALEKKHDEDLNDLYTELTGRKEGHRDSFSISRKSLTDSDSDSDSDYSFRPGFSTVKHSEPKTALADDDDDNDVEFVRSSSSVSIMHGGSRVLSPPRIQRSVSDLAFSTIVQHSTKSNGGHAEPPEVEVEFFGPVSMDNAHETASDDEDGDSSVYSGSRFDSGDSSGSEDGEDDDSDNDNAESSLGQGTKEKRQLDPYSCVFDVAMVEFAVPHAYKGSGDESDLLDVGYNSGSESDNESDSSDSEGGEDDDGELGLGDGEPDLDSASQLHLSPSDYAFIDPAKAVLERYYPKAGMLNLTADIDDLPDNYEGEGGAEPGASAGACIGEYEQFTHPGNGEKSFDDMEMELIAQLPATQRIAKFVYRASSHLLQGARGGLSLGFMLHNLEALAERFASNHAAILCAFVESLYQIVEPLGQAGDDGQSEDGEPVEDVSEQHPRSALARRANEGICSPLQAARRVAKLLHTFITLPDDQQTVLHQMEQLSEANGSVRPSKHALLLRIIYECELVDRSSIEMWYSSIQQEQHDGQSHTLPAVERSQLLCQNAASLLVELSNDSHELNASGSRISLDELRQQMQIAGGASSSTMSHSSASSSSSVVSLPMSDACVLLPPAVIGGHFAGVTTPASEENTTLDSHSSECEFAGNSKSNFTGTIAAAGTIGASILGTERRGGSRSLSGTAIGSDRLVDSYFHHCAKSGAFGGTMKPAKQVTFAIM